VKAKTQLYLLLLFLPFALFAFASAHAAPQPIDGQFIVILKESAAPPVIRGQRPSTPPGQAMNREAKEQGNRAARERAMAKVQSVRKGKGVADNAVRSEYADVVSGFAAKLTPAQKKALEEDPDVAGVFQDYVVTLGPISPEANASDITAAAQNVGCFVNNAGGFNDGSGRATWIWVLDTGIDLTHPDLNVQTSTTFAKSFISGQGVADGHGHGTHVAGIAAAKNNNVGMVGISAGARVVPVKVLSNAGSGSWEGVLAGLNHVAKYDIPGDVVNMSLGGYPYSNCENVYGPLRDAIRNLGAAGTWVVMAAGNDGGNANANLPGCINGNRVLTVGALACNKTCAAYSNWGSAVDWAATGSGVYSTHKGGGYATMSGTSMASPVIAGIVHNRNNVPLSAGNVSCKGATYKIGKLK
jgi:subtilisin family serine protease